MECLEPGLNVGETCSSDLRNPFLEPNMTHMATKFIENIALKKMVPINWTYKFLNNSMKNEEKAEFFWKNLLKKTT